MLIKDQIFLKCRTSENNKDTFKGEEAEQPLPREDDCLVGEGCDGALRGCEGGNQQSTPHKRGDIQCSCHYEYLIVGKLMFDSFSYEVYCGW